MPKASTRYGARIAGDRTPRRRAHGSRPIIVQAAVPISGDDDAETVRQRILAQEHVIIRSRSSCGRAHRGRRSPRTHPRRRRRLRRVLISPLPRRWGASSRTFGNRARQAAERPPNRPLSVHRQARANRSAATPTARRREHDAGRHAHPSVALEPLCKGDVLNSSSRRFPTRSYASRRARSPDRP
jgi:hypothetical protein